MGKNKKKRKTVRSGHEESLNKPDYAADTVMKPLKMKKPVPKETDIFVSDCLNNKTLQSLTKMKNQLLVDGEKSNGQSKQNSMGVDRVQKKSASQRIAEEPDLSFAELFDPSDEDEQSFEEILANSKLDCRKF